MRVCSGSLDSQENGGLDVFGGVTCLVRLEVVAFCFVGVLFSCETSSVRDRVYALDLLAAVFLLEFEYRYD